MTRILKNSIVKNNEKLYARGDEIDIEFRILNRDDKELVKGFKCGNAWIDKFINERAYKDKETVTYLAIDKALSKVISILTIECTGIYTAHSSNSKRRNSVISAFGIKYFGVDVGYQSIPYSNNEKDRTLSHQLFNKWMSMLILLSRTTVGAKKIVLYSVPEAESFYKRFGFINFKSYMAKDDAVSLNGCIPLYFSLVN